MIGMDHTLCFVHCQEWSGNINSRIRSTEVEQGITGFAITTCELMSFVFDFRANGKKISYLDRNSL